LSYFFLKSDLPHFVRFICLNMYITPEGPPRRPPWAARVEPTAAASHPTPSSSPASPPPEPLDRAPRDGKDGGGAVSSPLALLSLPSLSSRSFPSFPFTPLRRSPAAVGLRSAPPLARSVSPVAGSARPGWVRPPPAAKSASPATGSARCGWGTPAVGHDLAIVRHSARRRDLVPMCADLVLYGGPRRGVP
jgi:hypothetical protein